MQRGFLAVTLLLGAMTLIGGCKAVEKPEHHHRHQDTGKHAGTAKSHADQAITVDDLEDDLDMGSKTITQAELPEPTLDAFKRAHPGATINKIEVAKHGGDTHYELEFTDATGRKGEAEFDAAGKPVDD